MTDDTAVDTGFYVEKRIARVKAYVQGATQ